MSFDEHKLDRLKFFLRDDPHALSLAIDLIYLSHLADDLVDKDKERTKEDIMWAFRKVFVDMPNNPFYQQFYQPLSALIASAYLMWSNSVDLERGTEAERFACFQIRNSILNIIHHCVFLVGGSDWVDQVGPDFWREFAPTLEKWEELRGEQ